MLENYMGQYLKTHLQPVLGIVAFLGIVSFLGLCLSGNQQHSSISFQAELTFIKNTSILKQNIENFFFTCSLSVIVFNSDICSGLCLYSVR